MVPPPLSTRPSASALSVSSADAGVTSDPIITRPTVATIAAMRRPTVLVRCRGVFS